MNPQRGMIRSHLGRFDAAVADFDHALLLAPHDAEALYGRGLAHASQSRFDVAVADYTDCLDRNPKYTDCHAARALAYAAQRRRDEAVLDLRNYLSMADGTLLSRCDAEDILMELEDGSRAAGQSAPNG